MKFLKRLLCRHSFEFVRNIYGDEVIERGWKRAIWRCKHCGCVTHWTAIDPEYRRIGINMRMFDPELWQDLPRQPIDGASF